MTKPRSDYGPGERLNKGGVILEETMRAGVKRARVTLETALDWYYAKNVLCADDANRNQLLYDTGMELRNDWTLAGLDPLVISPYKELTSGGTIEEFMAMREDAYRRWRKAIEAVGPIAANEVIEVCCMGNRVGRVGLEILRRGLDVLARHYGHI